MSVKTTSKLKDEEKPEEEEEDVELRKKPIATNRKPSWIRRLFSSLELLPLRKPTNKSRKDSSVYTSQQLAEDKRSSKNFSSRVSLKLPSRGASLQLLPQRFSGSTQSITREHYSTLSYTQSSLDSAQSMPALNNSLPIIMRRRLPQAFDNESVVAEDFLDRTQSLPRPNNAAASDRDTNYTLQRKYLSLPTRRATMIFTPIRPRSTLRRSKKPIQDNISKMRKRLSSQLTAMQRLGPSHYLARIDELDDE